MARQDEKTTTLPGILPTVATGFDVVASHLWLVIIPIILDVFYWIGPQLRSTTLLMAMADLFGEVETMAQMADQLSELVGHTNLFTVLSVPYLGVPGLMAGIVMPERTPLQPLVWEAGSIVNWLLFFGLISFGGLLVSALFHALVARSVCNRDREHCTMVSVPGRSPWYSFLRRFPVYCLRFLGLSAALLLLALALYIPLVLVASILTIFNANLGSVIMLGGLVILIWLIFYLSFGLHGIFLRERPVLGALLDSIRLVQRHWLPALSLFLLIIAVRNLLAWIWLSVDTGSWLTLASIAGYAFINTSLVAATFIFYRDRLLER